MYADTPEEIAYSKSGFVRILKVFLCYHVEKRTIYGWKKIAGIYDREKSIKFMETWAG